ncbi:MAG: asparagine synthase C-terminal domain-containing protein [Candidatus Bathyarchaeia archaeon]
MQYHELIWERLVQTVTRNLGEAILLSGGLDSSLIAALAPQKPVAFTVSLEDYGVDVKFAELVANCLDIELHVRKVTVDEAIKAIPEVIMVLKTFDPAIPNDLATYFGLKLSREYSCETVMTGDGGDELFAGYDYMHNIDLKDYISKIIKSMSFNSNLLGSYLGVKVKQPFLDPEFMEFAMSIDPSLKVREVNGVTWGKWILRESFKHQLPKEVIWRRKTSIEAGSGFTKLREIVGNLVSESDSWNGHPVKLRSREHLYYYKIYMREVGSIPKPREGEKKCHYCGAGVPVQSSHCRTCGGYPT